MKRFSVPAAIALCLGIPFASMAPAQGLYFESTNETSYTPGGKPVKGYIMPKKFREDMDSKSAMIIRLDKDVTYFLVPENKTYSEMTFADMQAGMKTTDAAMQKTIEDLKKKMADMPQDQRKMVEKSMGKWLEKEKEPQLEVAPTAESKKICGYACQKYSVKKDGKEWMTVWATKDIPEGQALLKDWADAMRRLSVANRNLGGDIAAAYVKVGAFPMETRTEDMHTEVTKLERRSIPDAEFEVPGGYTKTQSPFQRATGAFSGADSGKSPAQPKAKPQPKVGPAFCASCGAKVEPGAKFCTQCGAKIGG